MNNWNCSLTKVLFNPRLSESERQLVAILPKTGEFESHVWITTSGSTGHSKFVAISKKGILASAKAVNFHLNSCSSDIWIHALPDFHVGGLGIWARAFLSGASVVDFKSKQEKWDPEVFYSIAQNSKATLTALVPTQVYDLVSKQIPAPPTLRAVIVGGGNLSSSTYNQGLELGWKLLPSYGLTECASQVATATPTNEFGYATLLCHVEVKIDSEGYISLKSPSLLTAYAIIENNSLQIIDPKQNGWFKTEDKGELKENTLKILGRSSDFVKIGGESCSLIHLRTVLEKITQNLNINATLLASPDDRLGKIIHLFIEKSPSAENLVNQFNAQVLPFEKIRKVTIVKKIPRSPLGKILYKDLYNEYD